MAETVPRAVLDTNVLLDWLLFAEPSVATLAAAVMVGQLRWVACAAMRTELSRTLGRPQLAHWQPDRERALGAFDRYAEPLAEPATLPLLRCTDPDDQVFLDLAVATGAAWLFTHDRALLRLARRAAGLGVRVLRPRDWQPELTRA